MILEIAMLEVKKGLDIIRIKKQNMKTVFVLVMLSLTFNSFCQEISRKKSKYKSYYSENSKLKVFYTDKSSQRPSEQRQVGIFVNDKFFGNIEILNFINSDKIETINIEKKKYKVKGIKYYGKFYIKMKSDYNPKFITLKKLSEKYLKLNENPIVYQIDEKVVKNSMNEIFIDENFILKIIVEKIKTSEKNTDINLVKLLTKTPENIKEANKIRIRGIENTKPTAHNDYK